MYALISLSLNNIWMSIPPHIWRNIVYTVGILLTIIPRIIQVICALYVKQPYHTSILLGEGWVQELLNGHPKCIQCELGVTKDDFRQLIYELQTMGHTRSRYVSLEEQLAIFHCTYVTDSNWLDCMTCQWKVSAIKCYHFKVSTFTSHQSYIFILFEIFQMDGPYFLVSTILVKVPLPTNIL